MYKINLFLISCLFSISLKAQISNTCFKAPNLNDSISNGTPAVSVCVGDFNGDGKIDLATANASSNNLSVLLQTNNANYAPAVNYAVGIFPRDISTSDFNGDNILDLVVANGNSNDISILLGVGSGVFSAAVNYSVGLFPNAISIADYNLDGKLDLAISNRDSNNLSILFGSGFGTFTLASTYSVGTEPSSVVSGDFNSDGNMDLATSNYMSDNVSVLLGLGSGIFAPVVNYSTQQYSNPTGIITGDFNNDGHLDLVVCNYGKSNIIILTGSSAGVFSVNFFKPNVGRQPLSISSADFNGDGKLDIVTSNSQNSDVSILLGTTGPIMFSLPSIQYGVNPTPSKLKTGDFNGDGKQDIVTEITI